MEYYRRYGKFLINGTQTVVPYVNIGSRPSDQKYVYRAGQSRLDKLVMKNMNHHFLVG